MSDSIIKPGIYRHFKGSSYKVIGLARHSETLEEMVVYKAMYGEGKVWVRPLKMFIEKVDTENGKVPRFELISEENTSIS